MINSGDYGIMYTGQVQKEGLYNYRAGYSQLLIWFIILKGGN